MKAIVWHGAHDLRFEDVAEPAEPGPGEAIVEVAWCGVCGTDLHEYTEGPVLIRPTAHALTGEGPPLVLGHEFSGRVVALGPGVAGSGPGLAVGQRVVVDPCWRCGTCYWCQRGEYHICRVGGSVGLISNGALARYVRVQAAGIVPLPDAVDDRVAALVEPLAVGMHAVSKGGVQAGDTVLVMGFGPIGAAVLLAARAAGATGRFVAEPQPHRRTLAEALGATAAFDPNATDVRREVFLRTSRVGPDVVFDCTGVPGQLPAAIDAARRGGRVVAVGVGHGGATVETNKIVLYERQLIGSLGYQHDLPRVVRLLEAGALDPRPLITAEVPLASAVEGAFDALVRDRSHTKVLVDVGGG
ncbi:MAG TPA: alcohol dehydrogenase catalytic domain-containing protein [Acidimicrobiales bacterium]|nr:alcohol dehydrogenase catalytic domain-containing protein [Acidimicrobiales bacterium]